MKVVLVYDRPVEHGAGRCGPEDLGAEYEDAPTLEALLGSIRAAGHEAAELALDEAFFSRIREMEPNLAFNIAEGRRGRCRESLVPAWLEHLEIPYTGSDGLTLAMTLDKALTKTLAQRAGIHTPPFRRVSSMEMLEGPELQYPLFVKPNCEGSSMGVREGSLVHDPGQLRRQVRWVLETYREDCLVEQYAPGPEYCVGVLGNRERELLPIVEVRSPRGFYPYEDKSAHRKELICPAGVPGEQAEKMRSAALRLFRLLKCRDMARVDFKLDAQGGASFLEINPLPGLSPHYGIFPRQAQAGGYSHHELIARIIDLATERTNTDKKALIP